MVLQVVIFILALRERYPLTSQLIQENKIPEFDNLYLDFNSIIHNCSHPNDGDAHFRLSEEQIFTAIFAYVDHLFGKIKPKKLFFMAVDGVAPRAKMNQQRSRRFRTAREAKELREKAERKGEKLPKEKAFDSNCITPGTPFMARLSNQLMYFVNKKISEDSDWQGIQVVLSGHEVPGEGEHKIMEYIRLSKAQPDYNPNVRHCLYGLDADLIMLGLLSHDPHFCLLREEVKFGPVKKRATVSLESQNFFLLHLSLLREYLDLEFSDLSAPSATNGSNAFSPVVSLPFHYSLERVIDDFILLAIFVGNDFLPNLPDLHINENGLEDLFEIYKRVLPEAGGYLVERGTINMQRLQLVLDELALRELEAFQRENMDNNYIQSKQTRYKQGPANPQDQHKSLTSSQRDLFDTLKEYVLGSRPTSTNTPLSLPNTFPARDREFLLKLATELNLSLAWDAFDEEGRNLVTITIPTQQIPEEDTFDDDGEGEWEDVDQSESLAAVTRVLKKYERMGNIEDEGDFDEREDRRVKAKVEAWKDEYYRNKLEFLPQDRKAAVEKLVYRYCEGLQWVMHYYYSGVASWGWFFDYHYAPRISDLKGLGNMQFTFDLEKPFRPFEQLMGVLPEASKELVPAPYRELMFGSESPILDFYPQKFDLDMNGKKQEWEAIVKIPFIQKDRLLGAMATRESQLTPEERKRNSFGTSTSFSYAEGVETTYPSSLPGFFPPISHCKCVMTDFDLPTLGGLHLVEGLCDGVYLGVEALAGFPSLETLPYTPNLGYHQVNVFQGESRNRSMAVIIRNVWEGKKLAQVARQLIGQRIFTGWPFLQEGLVTAISDDLFRYDQHGQLPHQPHNLLTWKRKAGKIEDTYAKRFAVITGSVDALVHVRPLSGLRRLDTGALVKDYDENPEKEVDVALQMGVLRVVSEDPRYAEKEAPPLVEEFPVGSRVIFLGDHAYGTAGQVSATEESSLSVILAFFPNERFEVEDLSKLVKEQSSVDARYYPAFSVASMLKIGGLELSKITSSLMVMTSDGMKHNVGLNLKFEAKSLKVLEYSRKNGRSWEFSEKAVQLIREYRDKFPDLFRPLNTRREDLSRASDIFINDNPEAKVKEVKEWLKIKGVRDLEPVSLFCDQLSKSAIQAIEKHTDQITASKSPTGIKKAVIKGVPRQAVLKPAHAMYRLQDQVFSLGDRVTMVQDAGSVPLCAKGAVVGVNNQSIDVVWDQPFMSGTTLGGRCSEYRGTTQNFDTCLNLTQKQFLVSMQTGAPEPRAPLVQPRHGPFPAVPPRSGEQPAAGFRPNPRGPKQIMTNPNRTSTNRNVDSGPNAFNEKLKSTVPARVLPVQEPRGSSVETSAPNTSRNGVVHHEQYPQESEDVEGDGSPIGETHLPNTTGNQRGRGRGFPPRGTRSRGPRGGRAQLRGTVPITLHTVVPPAQEVVFPPRARGRGRGAPRGRGLPRGGASVPAQS